MARSLASPVMTAIEVQPESLAEVGRRLARAAGVAGDIHEWWCSADISLVSVGEVGSERFASAVANFVITWSYGCGFLHADAKTLAGLLRRAGEVYLDMESAIAAGAQ